MEQQWIIFGGLALLAIAIGLTAWSFYVVNMSKLKNEQQQHTLKRLAPLQLQAYERLVLYLERTSINNLVMRLNQPGMTARVLHIELLKNIRQEYEHNLVQQLYVSDAVWELINTAREHNIQTINKASDKVDKEASSVMFSQNILTMAGDEQKQPNKIALRALKQEKRSKFGF